MKKSRAARDGSALKQVVLPPPLPAFDEETGEILDGPADVARHKG